MSKHPAVRKPKPTDRIPCEYCGKTIMRHLMVSHVYFKPDCSQKQRDKLYQQYLDYKAKHEQHETSQ